MNIKLSLGIIWTGFIFCSCSLTNPSNIDFNSTYNDSLITILLTNNLVLNMSHVLDTLDGAINCSNYQKDSILFKNAFPVSGYKLLFYYSEGHCQDCVFNQLQLLKLFEDSIKTDKLSFVGSFSSNRKMSVSLMKYDLPYDYYNVNFQDFCQTNISLKQPMYLLIDSKGVICQLHCPDPHNFQENKLTKMFLLTVIKRFDL